MTAGAITWEAAKLLLPLAGAVGVAWFAVHLALSRFKKERRWDRSVAALADAIAALSELRRVYGRWMDEHEGGFAVSKDGRAENKDRFKAAERRLDEASALAGLFLTKAINRQLSELERAREAVHSRDLHEFYSNHYSLLDDAIHSLIQDGSALLGSRES